MKLWRCSLVLVTVGLLAVPAPAGILFGKKTKPNPAERVPELIVIVKTDKDESKRASAAEELRQYDPTANPDIVPVLIDVLMNDPKPAVRVEAAESLGKLRPISQEAGWALEQAKEKDSSMRVRTKARYELLGYYWAGYHSDPKMKEGAVVNPKDVPMEKGKTAVPVPNGAPAAGAVKGAPEKVIVMPSPAPAKPAVTPVTRPATGQTAPPPLADPTKMPAPPPPGPAVPPPPAKAEPAPLPVIPLPPDGGPSLPGPGRD
jgi:hypothetical protein